MMDVHVSRSTLTDAKAWSKILTESAEKSPRENDIYPLVMTNIAMV